MSNLVVIDTPKGVTDLINYLEDKEFVSYDIETDGLAMNANIIGMSVCADDSVAYYIILLKWDTTSQNLVPVLSTDPQILKLLRLLQTKKLLMHNAIFDCSRTEAFFKVSLIEALHTDTMVLAHLLDENRRIGLKELGHTLFGEDSANEQAEMKASVIANGGKLTKTQYEMYKADAYIMAKYGAKDALLTYKLFYELIPDLMGQELDKFFYDEECMPLLKGCC